MLKKDKMDKWYIKVLFTDYKNFFYYFKSRLYKIIFWISRVISNKVASMRFSTSEKWLIKPKNLEKYLKIAKPWDILLTRWNWNAINVSIPGFWKHMSMYIWTWKFINKHFEWDFLGNLDERLHYIIEATWGWVNICWIDVLVSHNDYLWVSRSNFKKEKIIRTIKNAIDNIWKWYDYIFNFNSDKNLVCSELIMKSFSKEFEWDEWIDIELENIWISLTYPPNNFINKIFSNKSELKPIIFIDSIEKTWNNFINTNNEFNKSWNRSRFSFFLK